MPRLFRVNVASCKYRLPGRMIVRFLLQLLAFCRGAAAAGAAPCPVNRGV